MFITQVYIAYPAEVQNVPIWQSAGDGFIYVSCVINGTATSMVMDTAAQMTLISTNFADKTGITKTKSKGAAPLTGVGKGGTAKIYEVTIIIAGVPVVCDVSVSDLAVTDVENILALNDLLKAYDLNITSTAPYLVARGDNTLTKPQPIPTTPAVAAAILKRQQPQKSNNNKKKGGKMAFAMA